MSEITLIPSASFALRDIYPEQGEVLDLIARDKLRTQDLFTHRFPLDRINEAFAVTQAKEETGAIFVGLLVYRGAFSRVEGSSARGGADRAGEV